MNESLAVNATISHYRILCRIGAGGMGEVYRAEDTKLGRRVAIKLLPTTSSCDGNANQRLIRQARAAAALDHPNICAISEVGGDGIDTYIVLQYVEGETLAATLKRPLSLAMNFEMGWSFCMAREYDT